MPFFLERSWLIPVMFRRFPTAGVWPPLPSKVQNHATVPPSTDQSVPQLPEPAEQEHLLDLYFTYVHPSFPIIHKEAFFNAFKTAHIGGDSPQSTTSSDASSTHPRPFNSRPRPISTLLLLAMFAIAARYSSSSVPPPPPDGSMMWPAGDDFFDQAKVILDRSYASSRSSTCQALLLMGYREIGIGAMAQAWTYIGMAVRMAQDLGMHRSADGWARVGLGGRLFNDWELHQRKRIWYGCVIMDKYVSTYIGRPLSIFERDFNTPLPSENNPEEFEEWKPHTTDTDDANRFESVAVAPVEGRIVSCFNASATLSGLLSVIVQSIYAAHPVSSRHTESVILESQLDKWYIELPEHLRHEPGSSKHPVPLPHVLTLHMQYWCAVLLLHRPFIRHCTPKSKHICETSDDREARAITERSYELCAGAANHITAIVTVYLENYPISRSAVFLCYYIFTASIMHVTTLSTYPSDPQARMGLTRCMEALKKMEIVWPSAGRALELLAGSKVNLQEAELAELSNHPDRHKRSAEQDLDAEDIETYARGQLPNYTADYLALQSQGFDTSEYGNDGRGVYTNGAGLQSVAPPPQAPFTNNDNAYMSSADRWPPDGGQTNPFSGPLSTSVLPQLYSTGLVDDPATSGVRIYANSYDRGVGYEKGRPYPQYWNDCTTFPQLGTAYGNMSMQFDQNVEPDSGQSSANTSTVYLPEEYNIYMPSQRPPPS